MEEFGVGRVSSNSLSVCNGCLLVLFGPSKFVSHDLEILFPGSYSLVTSFSVGSEANLDVLG